MLHSLRAVARLFQKYIGWNRVGVLLSLVIIGVALKALVGMIHHIDFADVVVAIKATPLHNVFLAALFEILPSLEDAEKKYGHAVC